LPDKTEPIFSDVFEPVKTFEAASNFIVDDRLPMKGLKAQETWKNEKKIIKLLK
jgi:hypothetical protein